jgi:hypothetical protein
MPRVQAPDVLRAAAAAVLVVAGPAAGEVVVEVAVGDAADVATTAADAVALAVVAAVGAKHHASITESQFQVIVG